MIFCFLIKEQNSYQKTDSKTTFSEDSYSILMNFKLIVIFLFLFKNLNHNSYGSINYHH